MSVSRALDNIKRYPADAEYWLLQALLDQLETSTKYLIEKECLQGGEVPDRKLRALIEDNQEVITALSPLCLV